MTAYLIDTNVVSELTKRRRNPGVVAWFEAVSEDDLFLSALTIGELRRGVSRLPHGDPKRIRLSEWIDELTSEFSDRILPIDLSVAQKWGELSAERTLPVVDALLAATAATHDLILVTRNLKDVEGTLVRVLDPFDGTVSPPRS